MRRLLVLRPEPGASETAARAEALGWRPILLPLFETRALAWSPPDPHDFDAVMLTSAAAVRRGGSDLARYFGLPAYAVGAATAATALDAGFGDVRIGSGSAADLLARAADDGVRRLLHLAGREHRAVAGAGMSVRHEIVYAAEPVEIAPDLLAAIAAKPGVALIHSPRAGARFAELIPRLCRGSTALAAISAAALAPAGGGWSRAEVAAEPTDAALLAAAALVCDQPAGE